MPDTPAAASPIPDIETLVPSDTVLHLSARAAIDAPAELVFRLHNDTRTWGEWNSFVARVEVAPGEGVLREGSRMTMHVRMGAGEGTKAQRMLVTEAGEVADAYRVAWRVEGFPRMALRTNRVSEVVPRGEGRCEYRTWEAMAGPLAWTVKYMYGETLQGRFEGWAAELKEFAERRCKEDEEGSG